MKYIVVCYSVHEKNIASYDVFNNKEDAILFLEEDASNTYKENIENYIENERGYVDFTLDRNSAYLSLYDGEYEWTWEIIEV